jgi:hypothetical protein
MRDATRNTRHRRISCATSSWQRTSSSMREALFSTTSAQHGTDATHKMQHTTGAAACSKHTRNRHHAAGNAMHGMRRKEAGRSRTSRLRQASGESARKGRQDTRGVRALGDASDVAARRLHISLACAHRGQTDVDRLRCGIRARLGAREAHAGWFLLQPATATASFTRSDEASGSFYNISPQRTRGSSFAPLVPLRCHAWSVLPGDACSRRATSRQARSA